MLDRFSGDEDWLGKGAEFEPDTAADRGAGERAPQGASAQVSARRAIEEYRERQRLKRMLDDIFTEEG